MKEIKEKVSKLKDQRLVAIVCRDENDFILNYFFDKNGKITVLNFKVQKKKPIVESIIDVYPNADYYEREIHDFFGIEFKGNPKLHLKLFLADEWEEKPPLLKKEKKVK